MEKDLNHKQHKNMHYSLETAFEDFNITDEM